MIGYPNVGKSSIINTLRKKKVCTVAPIPGETKVWQYISLMKRINLIDCPGIVPPNMNDTPEDILLRGVVRIENVEHPSHYIPALMSKVKRHHMERTYDLRGWDDYMTFLELLARKNGRLLKGGEPDVEGIAKMVVHDFLRGKIPWFSPCPSATDLDGAPVVAGREGKLGEMPKKRKRDAPDADEASTMAQSTDGHVDGDEDGEDFTGFGSVEESEDESAPGRINDDTEEREDEEAEEWISLGASSDEEEVSGGNQQNAESVELEDESDPGGAPTIPNEHKAVRSNKRRRR